MSVTIVEEKDWTEFYFDVGCIHSTLYCATMNSPPITPNGLGDPARFVKLIADSKHDELLGYYLIGPDMPELPPELTLARK